METGIPKIGIFDSGIGGLTVLRDCFFRLSEAEYFYFGDNAHAPYGNREEGEIVAFVEHALKTFEALHVDAAVLACNTATTVCIGQMRKKFSFPILGTEPAVLPAAREGKEVLVLCTPRTAASKRLKELLAECPETRFTVCGCPALAAAVEKKFLRGEEIVYAEHLPAGTFDGVVLGCTHYALVKREIAAFYGAPVYDGAEGVARRLEHVLAAKDVDNVWMENGKINKSLPSKWSEKGHANVCFLGKTAKINRKVFKQTF